MNHSLKTVKSTPSFTKRQTQRRDSLAYA